MHFEIPFYGHANIRSLHQKTIEITTEPNLTLNGDCVIGVKASFGCSDIPARLKSLLKNSKSEVLCTIIVKDLNFKIKGKGNEKLTFTNPHDIVIRKSSFVASDSIPRQMIKLLQNPDSHGIFAIDVI
ncbi:MAG: DUF371 domain-containing protein [Thaumarchaeota archaeon]|nr:MAG: DUF371 domain-containing protein [Nitrososphaerota archaeon]